MDPFKVIRYGERWLPSNAQDTIFESAYEKILPPLVYKIRIEVEKWRENDYIGCSDTTKALLNYWFNPELRETNVDFNFYFSQREAIESVIYLYEVAKAKDKYELLRYDSSGRITTGSFEEDWTRYVIKMATGAGKTKVMGLTLVWSYFNKLYEDNCTLSKNILVITPNIIVLNRIKKDFENFNMFFDEPFIPDNGFEGRNWKNDFQPTFHFQDEIRPISDKGNVFLTNVHRIFFDQTQELSFEETFLGTKPKQDADKSIGVDLGKVLRSDKISDLLVLNDEAHHIHNSELAWFKNIQDINNKLKLKSGNSLCLQADFSATPKHNNGSIFVQTICDFPLVEAINYNVVKTPVLPDTASRGKIAEHESDDFIERYKDYIELGYIEWEKQYKELKNEKTPILFVMTNDTKEADILSGYLERTYPLLKNSVLTIHTNKEGDIKESVNSKKDKEELDKLRKAADEIDSPFSNYKAVVSVLMLREGWDVKNVTTIVGLRPFKAASQILPEQTIGRGLRKMFSLNQKEELVVIGTQAFLEFVESLKAEGVTFDYSPMGIGTRAKTPLIIEIDRENKNKDLDKLDIPIPILSSRYYREFKQLDKIDITSFNNKRIALKEYTEDELKEIIFTDINGNYSHKTVLENVTINYRNIIGFFTNTILKESRLVTGFDILYPKVEDFIKNYLFDSPVKLNDPKVIRNLSEAETKSIIFNNFKDAIDKCTVKEKTEQSIKGYISLKSSKLRIVNNQPFIVSKKSVYNKIVCDNNFELEFAAALENKYTDVVAYAKNYIGEGGPNFKIEYQAENGNIREYYPDFFVKTDETHTYIVETKGREDLNDIRKINRLITWCNDVNKTQNERILTAVYVKQEEWEKYNQSIKSFNDLLKIFILTEKI
jgi:type III restriction enzyme